MKTDLMVGGLLVVAWTLSSFGTAQQNWPLVWAAIPSLTIALIVHIVGLARRNRDGRHAITEIKAKHADADSPDVIRQMEARTRTDRGR